MTAKLTLATLLTLTALSAQSDQLAQLRNLGKAFYENPTTQKEAVDTLKQALDLSPTSHRERLNYGLALLKAGKGPEAIAELLRVQKDAPQIPHTWFTLAIEFKKQGDTQRALDQMLGASKLDSKEPIIRYNLGVLYKQLNQPDKSLVELEAASRLDPNLGAARFQLFNAYRAAGRADDAKRELAAFQNIKKLTEGAAVPEDVDWCQYSEIYDPAPPAPPRDNAPLQFTDRPRPGNWLGAIAFGNQPLLWDAQGIQLGATRIIRLPGIRSVAAGDFDNDGLPDLCVVADSGASLWKNARTVWTKTPFAAPAGKYSKCLFLDFDHDYDLDVFLLGDSSALMRNQGTAGFADRTADFPFVKASALDATAFRAVADTRGFDLIVSYANQSAVLYRDRLLGKYDAQPLSVIPSGATGLLAADLNSDGEIDLLFTANAKPLRSLNRKATLTAPEAAPNAFAADLHNSGTLDYADAAIALDLNADGKLDLLTRRGAAWVDRLNTTATTNRSITIRLDGVKNLKSAPSAEVEVKIGGLYQKHPYVGFPLQVGIGKAAKLDVVRITWPNGLVQNEMNQPIAKPLQYKEAQRLSGSCPIVWTWNGAGFEYITDVLGVAPLGASAGDGTFFAADHDEYISISGTQLRPNPSGHLEIRLTEELSEAAYFDQVRLLAVDHPEGTSIYSNEKWKAPPFPEFRLFGVDRPIHATRATDHKGNDVTGLLAARDRSYPNAYSRSTTAIAEMHSLTLDFGAVAKTNQAILVLHGWVDWADGSTFLAAAQEGPGLIAPYLQVKDAAGKWVTVVEDMGMPSGKPKAIVVDLTGKFLSASREVRIVTNLCVYWDEIFLGESSAAPDHHLTPINAIASQLRFRGFSPSIIHPERKQPEEFLYPNPEPTSLWNPTPGNYTRYGNVLPLVSAIDDRLVVMGSGDELQLEFNPASLPLLPAGWRRDFLLHVDGWAKDRDANTAFSQDVSPLPFHSMSGYPYSSDKEKHPEPDAQRQFNTRPALRLIRPLGSTR